MSPYILLSLACFFWSLNFIIGKLVVDVVPPVTISLFRWGLPALFYLWAYLPEISLHWSEYKRRWPLIVWLGATGYSLNSISVYEAVQFTSTINTSFINAFNPVLIALTGFVLYGYQTSLRQILGFILSLTGVSCIIFRGDPSLIVSLNVNVGDLFMVGSIIAWSIHTCGYKRYAGVLPANSQFAMMMLAGTLVTLPLAVTENYCLGLEWIGKVSLRHIVGMLCLSIFPSILAYRFWNQALYAIDANKVAVFQYLIPVYTVIISVLLGERLQMFQVVGGGLIFSGVLLVTVQTAKSRRGARQAGNQAGSPRKDT